MTFLESTACIIMLRCESYMEAFGLKDAFKGFPRLQSFIMRIGDKDARIWSQNFEDPAKRSTEAERYFRLLDLLGNDRVLQSCLDLSIALFNFPEFGACLSSAFGSSVNLSLAYRLEGMEWADSRDIMEKAEKLSSIAYLNDRESPLQYVEFQLDESVMGYLAGSTGLGPAFRDIAEIRSGLDGLHEPFIHQELIESGALFLKSGGLSLQISGNGGRRFIAQHIAARLNKAFIFLSIEDFLREAGKNIWELRSALIREAVLNDSGICFYGISDEFLSGRSFQGRAGLKKDAELLERMLFLPIVKRDIPLILLSDVSRPLIKSLGPKAYSLLELPQNTGFDKRKALWEGFGRLYGLELDSGLFAMRYHLNASGTAKAIKSYMDRFQGQEGACRLKEAEAISLFSRICLDIAGAELDEGLGRLSRPALRLSDVKLGAGLMGVLKEVVDAVLQDQKVLYGWGLEKRYPYGKAVSVLLSGPPGTGKTMTANALAGELSLPLYQVNIANIVDKYIGETEKNLEKAFTFAEKTNSILFFDEADAIFGKRSEIADSKDKYANSEISYLLQRIEAYEGIVVMATNFKGNMDPAFLRRIRYVLLYENPDASTRRAIWESCLTDDLPYGELDLDYLSEQFQDFNGSRIKTVFLNACVYASSSNENLGMKHIIHAIKRELEKTATVTFKMESLGKYAYLDVG